MYVKYFDSLQFYQQEQEGVVEMCSIECLRFFSIVCNLIYHKELLVKSHQHCKHFLWSFFMFHLIRKCNLMRKNYVCAL